MERNIKDLGTAENILILCSRFWLKAHVFRCNTPLILIDHTFKAAKLDNCVRDFHTLMMGLSHVNKSHLRSDFMTSPSTSKTEDLLIEIVTLAQKDMEDDLRNIFGPASSAYIPLVFFVRSRNVIFAILEVSEAGAPVLRPKPRCA